VPAGRGPASRRQARRPSRGTDHALRFTRKDALIVRKWKVGIVGLRRGEGFVSVFAAHSRVEVVGLCDLETESLSRLGAAFGLPDSALFTQFDEFVQAPMDIVIVATPIRYHAEQTIQSLESGKHVLCEQTAAYTLGECERIVEAVKRAGLTYMMAENYCYFHYIRQWHDLIRQGKLGGVFYAEAEYVHEIEDLLIDRGTGAYHWRHERPPIWYCAHCIGPLLMLMDDRIVQACGSHAGFHKHPQQNEHLGFLDAEVGLFRTGKGALIKILRSQVAPRYPRLIYYSLYGTRGCLENGRFGAGTDGQVWIDGETPDDANGHRSATPMHCDLSDPNAPEEAYHGGHGTSEYYMIRDFLDAVESGSRPPIDVVRAMDFTVPGIVAHDSAMSDGNWRDVPLFDW